MPSRTDNRCILEREPFMALVKAGQMMIFHMTKSVHTRFVHSCGQASEAGGAEESGGGFGDDCDICLESTQKFCPRRTAVQAAFCGHVLLSLRSFLSGC